MNTKEIDALPRLSPEDIKTHPSFSHVTRRQWCGCECINAYFRCSDSPSGVILVTGWSDADSSTKTKSQAVEELKAVKDVFNRIYQGPTRGEY